MRPSQADLGPLSQEGDNSALFALGEQSVKVAYEIVREDVYIYLAGHPGPLAQKAYSFLLSLAR
jgi:hypothetical protein